MADTLPSPPSSRSDSPVPQQDDNNEKLSRELDNLLEQYLEFLDTYTKLREDLSKSLSTGFFSLAQAQRTSTLGAGRRYGEECYDQRMKAQKLVKIEENESSSVMFRVQRRSPEKVVSYESETASKSVELIPQNNAQNPAGKDVSSPATSSDPIPQRAKQDPALRNPLTWFGILAPSGLRQVQSNFVQATGDIVPALLTVDSEMKSLEEKIWALRRELGSMSEYGDPMADMAESNEIDDLSKATSPLDSAAVSKPSNTRMQKISQKPPHAKSTLLKLGD